MTGIQHDIKSTICKPLCYANPIGGFAIRAAKVMLLLDVLPGLSTFDDVAWPQLVDSIWTTVSLIYKLITD